MVAKYICKYLEITTRGRSNSYTSVLDENMIEAVIKKLGPEITENEGTVSDFD